MTLLFIALLIFSILAGIFLIYKPELASLYFNRNITRKQIVIGFLIYMLIFLPMMGAVLSLQGGYSLAAQKQRTNTAPTASLPTTIPTREPIQAAGLNIDRATLMNEIQQQNPDATFSAAEKFDRQEMYTSVQWMNTMKLIGPADNLTEFISTEPLDPNPSSTDNLETFIYILGIARLIDPDTIRWVDATIPEVNTQFTNGTTSITKTFTIHKRQYQFVVQNNTATLTIKPANH